MDTKLYEELKDMKFEAKHIHAVTGGALKPDILKNWNALGRFTTPMEPPGQGRKRLYPLIAVYEACALLAIRRAGVELKDAQRWLSKFWKGLVRGELKGVIVWAYGDKNPHFFAHDATILQIQKELGEKITIGMVDFMALMNEVNEGLRQELLRESKSRGRKRAYAMGRSK